MAKQAGARIPDGLGRGARARGAGIPQTQRPAHAPDGRAAWGDSAEYRFGGDGRDNSFFPTREISERAELLRKHLPDEAAEILREADEICGHRFRLLGYEHLEFTLDRDSDNFGGNNFGGDNSKDKDIDWHLDPVHGKRAPLDPWFKIPFLDFAVVGDHKVTWELNRHQHLVTLCQSPAAQR